MLRKQTKCWLIIAAALVVAGSTLGGVTMAMLHGDFTKLANDTLETHTTVIGADYTAICVDTNTADVTLAAASDGQTTVVCHEFSRQPHSVTVENGTLHITCNDNRRWYQYIGIQISTPSVTVYLPQPEYDALTVTGSTGDVTIGEKLLFGSITASVSTGDVTNLAGAREVVNIRTTTGAIAVRDTAMHSLALSVGTGSVTVENVACTGDVLVNVNTGKATLSALTCNSFSSDGGTGDLTLTNTVAAAMTITRNTGDVTFDNCDAAEIGVKTNTGNVRGTLRSTKRFVVNTRTGNVSVPPSAGTGLCDIATTTGDVRLALAEE